MNAKVVTAVFHPMGRLGEGIFDAITSVGRSEIFTVATEDRTCTMSEKKAWEHFGGRIEAQKKALSYAQFVDSCRTLVLSTEVNNVCLVKDDKGECFFLQANFARGFNNIGDVWLLGDVRPVRDEYFPYNSRFVYKGEVIKLKESPHLVSKTTEPAKPVNRDHENRRR